MGQRTRAASRAGANLLAKWTTACEAAGIRLLPSGKARVRAEIASAKAQMAEQGRLAPADVVAAEASMERLVRTIADGPVALADHGKHVRRHPNEHMVGAAEIDSAKRRVFCTIWPFCRAM